jgi:SAM-dependent methyltransferase
MSADKREEEGAFDALRSNVAHYYGGKVEEHGPTPRGVDWNSPESQRLRFAQLLRLIPRRARDISMLDFGCGYGALVEELEERYTDFRYQGFDLSPEMIARARERYGRNLRCTFTTDPTELRPAAYVVASGVLNVKLTYTEEEWTEYFEATVRELATLATSGFAFNALTSYSDPERQRQDLYYADPTLWFDFCKRHISRFVSLVHDYPLYEFTMLVTMAEDRS